MKHYKGSQRCMLELISSANFVAQINSLIQTTGAVISSTDKWLPKGLHDDREAELKDFLAQHFSSKLGIDIQNWWLSFCSARSRTPNLDLVSTCNINSQKGLLMIEAKAHYDELDYESKGKLLAKNASSNSKANHAKIAQAINEANIDINKVVSGVSLSRDKCYQLSNRTAHA